MAAETEAEQFAWVETLRRVIKAADARQTWFVEHKVTPAKVVNFRESVHGHMPETPGKVEAVAGLGKCASLSSESRLASVDKGTVASAVTTDVASDADDTPMVRIQVVVCQGLIVGFERVW